MTSSELKHEAARYSSIVLAKVIATPWIRGAEEFLERYFTELPLFVVSGTPHDELQIILEQRRISHYFKEICGSPRRKPVIVYELLERYGISSDSGVFIGDALTDYHAAKETGLAFIGIQGDVTFPEDVLVLPDCGQLAPILAKSFILHD